MAQDQSKQEEEKFDFTRDGQVLGYISLDQAQVLAMRTARESPGAYGGSFVDVPMAFEVVNNEETEDHYVITLSFRPQGQFSGNPGQEQFFIEKEGSVAHRQVLSAPTRRRRLPVLPTAIGSAVVGVVALVAVFGSGVIGGNGGDDSSPIGVTVPTPIILEKEVLVEKEVVNEVPVQVVVEKEVVKEVPVEVVVEKEVLVTATPVPTPGQRRIVPTPVPNHTPTPAGFARPGGTLNVGMRVLGTYMGHPRFAGIPQILINSASGITETLLAHNTTDGAMEPMLAESWSISSDFRTWTFNLRQGVQFHKDWGGMSAEDVVWSLEQMSGNERHPQAAAAKDIWFNQRDSVQIIDDYTLVVNTGIPVADFTMYGLISSPRWTSAWVTSRTQSERSSPEEANRSIAATGPWEITEWHGRSGGFWRLNAVRDHWRKTPFFEEMVLWDVPEEASRLAGFLTGQLDTYIADLESIPEIESVNGARIMRVPNAGEVGLNFYGLSHVGVGTQDQWPNYNPKLPWVSGNPDVRSPGWEQARKVREALSIAIDRDLIVDAILQGFGRPLALRDWAGFEHLLPQDIHWDYDPERAKELLAEAGYPDGFSITLTPVLRGVPAEVETCEAVATMWDAIGVKVEFQRVSWGEFRPSLTDRTYQGATCHSLPPPLSPGNYLGLYLHDSNFSFGAEHPFLEGLVPKLKGAVSPDVRRKLELESARWMFENYFGQVGLFVFDGAWAVGPRVQPWLEHVRRGEFRTVMNGMEWARPQ